MYILITFQLTIKNKTFSNLWSIPTNQPQHILIITYNSSHHFITYFSYFNNLFTQLLHHISYNTNSISFSRPPRLISHSFHPQHPITLSSPANNTHQSSSFSVFTNFSFVYYYWFTFCHKTFICSWLAITDVHSSQQNIKANSQYVVMHK